MIKFIADREQLLKPLQMVQGVVERRQTLPILSNVLVEGREDGLSLTATDMEVELVARLPLAGVEPGEATVPARKLIDICRALPQDAKVSFSADDGKATIRAGKSRFTLATLPAADYPSTDALEDDMRIRVEQRALKSLIELTHFAVAHQDVRYYLNGLLLEVSDGKLVAVATDGHRLALAEMEADVSVSDGPRQLIVPRKGVGELLRLLGPSEEPVELVLGSGAIQARLGDARLTSKLIDGRFPDYDRVIPDAETCDKVVAVDREMLRQGLARASILSNEKYRAIRLSLEPGVLRLMANNPDQEQAEDEVEVEYEGDPLEVGFNVSYLIDALNALPTERVHLYLSDPSSSCLLQPAGRDDCRYVVMPMRL